MNAPAVTRMYVVRHGETDWNRVQRLQGTIDTFLNPIGFDQARRVASWFATRRVSHVITSPLARARQTAISIARCSRCALTVDAHLIEIDHGSWAGLTLPQIARMSPGAVVDGQLQSESLDVSGGEAIDAAYMRASFALRRLLAGPPQSSVVVVSHGVTNALLVCAALGNAPTRMGEYMQPNGFVHVLRFRRRTLVSIEYHSVTAPAPDVAERHSSAWSASQ